MRGNIPKKPLPPVWIDGERYENARRAAEELSVRYGKSVKDLRGAIAVAASKGIKLRGHAISYLPPEAPLEPAVPAWKEHKPGDPLIPRPDRHGLGRIHG